MNKVILIGNICNDIEMRQTQSGTMTARFRIAVFRSKQGDQTVSDFISCTAFGANAEFISKHFAKGSKIAVSGNIKTGSYDDKETGKKVYTTEIWVEGADIVERRQQNAPAPQGQTYNQPQQGQPAYNQQGYQQAPSQPAQPAYQGYPQDYDYGNVPF